MIDVVLWLLALMGHIGLWCAIFNQLHATAFPRPHRKISEVLIYLVILLPLAFAIIWLFMQGWVPFRELPTTLRGYGWLSIGVGVWLAARWLLRQIRHRAPTRARLVRSVYHHIQRDFPQPLLAGTRGRFFGRLPGNQSLDLQMEFHEFLFPNLHPDLDGVKICHLSDFHFTGMILPEYFQIAIEKANAQSPDLVVITGDFIDEERCLDWLDSVLSQIKPVLGTCYVLGNHDRRVSEPVLRQHLQEAGLQAVADGQWHDLTIGLARLRIAGNELPWYRGAESLPSDSDLPPADFRLLLSHSPDQLKWARHYGFDLMLAGHTHGGQIRFPIIGPIVAPSCYGVKYASGTFQIGDMIMHVSRGLSGDEPIRWNCPPELSMITLRRDESVGE